MDPGYTPLHVLLAALAGAVCGSLLAWLLASPGAALTEARELRGRERAEAERAVGRLHREIEDLAQRSRENTEAFQLLPDLLRQMFSATGRRGVAPPALRLVDELFRPEQCAFFVARPTQRRLALAAGRSLPPSIAPGVEVGYGQGRVGWVAENRLSMDEGDFKGATGRLRRTGDSAEPRDLRTDVAAPVEDGADLLGVLTMGGARARHGQEKRLLKMVADFTALALVHVGRLRSVEEAANVDGLTGLYNKRCLLRRLGDEIHRAEEEGGTLGLLLLDVDHFKTYNDTHGHLEGDEVLRGLGQILRGSIREDDVAARYGGEEFVVLFLSAGKALTQRLAEALRQAVASHAFPHRERQPLGAVTFSGGVAAFPEDARSAVDLLRCADQALYEAKAAGRNRIVAAPTLSLT